MLRVVNGTLTDDDARAVSGRPPGWTLVCVDGWYASPTLAVGSELFDPLGPFETAGECVDAAWVAHREGQGHD